jgi:hypothetical protein
MLGHARLDTIRLYTHPTAATANEPSISCHTTIDQPRWRYYTYLVATRSRGVGKNGARNRVRPSSLLNTCQGVIVTITDQMAAWRRERRVLQRVSRAAWRLEQAGRERAWALASARAEGVSIRTLAAAAGLSPARVHQITAAADLDELDAALGELRAAGWPAPEDPGGDDDAELDGRDLIRDRLVDEVGWQRRSSARARRRRGPGGDQAARARCGSVWLPPGAGWAWSQRISSLECRCPAPVVTCSEREMIAPHRSSGARRAFSSCR